MPAVRALVDDNSNPPLSLSLDIVTSFVFSNRFDVTMSIFCSIDVERDVTFPRSNSLGRLFRAARVPLPCSKMRPVSLIDNAAGKPACRMLALMSWYIEADKGARLTESCAAVSSPAVDPPRRLSESSSSPQLMAIGSVSLDVRTCEYSACSSLEGIIVWGTCPRLASVWLN